MTYQQLQYFVSVAELLNFTKAANLHYTAQSAISQQISALERELGVTLLTRSTHSVLLTEAGEAFYATARQVTRLLDYGIANAKNIQTESTHESIRVGFVGTAEDRFLPRTIRIFKEQYPDIRLELMNCQTPFDLKMALQDRQCNAGFLFANDIDSSGKLEFEPLLDFPMCVYLSKLHPLAACSTMTLVQLPEDLPQAKPTTDHNRLQSGGLLSMADGPEPSRTLITDSLESCMMLIGAGLCYGIFPSYVQSVGGASVVCLPLVDGKDVLAANAGNMRDTTMVLAWPKGTRSALIDKVLHVLRESIQQEDTQMSKKTIE